MTQAAEVEPTQRRRPTFVIPLLVLVIALLLAWQFGVLRPKPTVALVTSGDTPFWDTVVQGANDAADVYGVKLKVIRSKTDEAQQTSALRELENGKYDGVAVSPINPAAQAAVLSDLAAQTTLVTLDSDSPISKRLCFVGTDNYHAGRLAGEHLKQALPDGGDVVLFIGNLDKDNAQRRRQGVIDELLERPYEPDHPMDPADAPLRGGKYNIVSTVVDHSDPEETRTLAVAAIKDNANIKGFVGLLGYSTPALLKALQETGNLGRIKVVGFDAADATLDGIEAGHVAATIVQDQYGFGFHSVRILAENASGNTAGLPLFQRRTLPCEQVTRENVAAVRNQLKTLASDTGNRASR